MRLTYKDPLEYDNVRFKELCIRDTDCIYLREISIDTNEYISNGYFHDYHCDIICSKFPNIKTLVRTKSFILCKHDVFLSGYRCYIGRDGSFCLDDYFSDQATASAYLRKLTMPDQYNNELSGLKYINGEFVFDTKDRHIITINEPVVSITSDEAPNFGSFIIKILPKLLDACMFDNGIKILVPWYSDSILQYIRLSGIDENRIIRQEVDKIYNLKKVYIPCIRNKDFHIDLDTQIFYANIRMRLGAPQVKNKKIYISRKKFNDDGLAFHNRRLTNEEAVSNVLENEGYEIVYPEKLSVPQQIQTFSSANVIIGVSGSALFNTVFCYKGTKIMDIESEPHWYENHARLFNSLELNFGIFEANPMDRSFKEHHVPFSIDIQRLLARANVI